MVKQLLTYSENLSNIYLVLDVHLYATKSTEMKKSFHQIQSHFQ